MVNNKHEEEENLHPIPFWRDKVIWKRFGLVGGGICGLLLVAVFFGYPRLKDYQRKRSLKAATVFLETQDYRSAYLLLDQFTKREPHNLEARRLLARTLDGFAPDQSIIEWEALAKKEPGNAANLVGYATCALRLGQLDKLAEALAALRGLQPEGADYNRLAAAAALARRDVPALREALGNLAGNDPQNVDFRFGLANLQMNSAQPAEVAAAREALEEFARGDAVRIRAVLVLLRDVPRRWPAANPVQAQSVLARRLGLGVSVREGTKQYLWAGLRDQHEPDLEDIILYMQGQPAPRPGDVALLAAWMIEQNKFREAYVWLRSLDASTRDAPQVLSAMAACALAAGQWTELEEVLLKGAWGPVPAEAVRYAFAARKEREAGNESKAESLWNNAVEAAESSQPGLRMLVRIAGHWRWPRKLEQALWALVQRFPNEQEAWQKLATAAITAQDTARVWRIYSSWARANPADRQAQVNRVVLGIFIRPDEPGLEASIEEIGRLEPANPGSQLAQAMVLWRAKRWVEARALLDRIPIKSSEEPRLALARGLVLASLGQAAEAEATFAVIPTGVLLPEETALMAAARKRA